VRKFGCVCVCRSMCNAWYAVCSCNYFTFEPLRCANLSVFVSAGLRAAHGKQSAAATTFRLSLSGAQIWVCLCLPVYVQRVVCSLQPPTDALFQYPAANLRPGNSYTPKYGITSYSPLHQDVPCAPCIPDTSIRPKFAKYAYV